MTLQQMMEQVLMELHRPQEYINDMHWQCRLKGYANEALMDIATAFRPWARDEGQIVGGTLNLCLLPKLCLKVLKVERGGERIPFYYAEATDKLCFKGAKDGQVVVTYRYMPLCLNALCDEPQLPQFLHPLIVTYMTAREVTLLDEGAKGSARLNLSLYESLKRRLRVGMDEPTGELINAY